MSSWRNSKKAFDQQLELNLRQLFNPENYPPNWKVILRYIGDFLSNSSVCSCAPFYFPEPPTRIVELGCGVGALAYLIHKNYPTLMYFGYDDAEYAIKLAEKNFVDTPPCIPGYINFCNAGYEEAGRNRYKPCELIIANALCDVMEDGDAIFEDILKQDPKRAIFSRMKVVDEKSYTTPYTAYDCVETFAFHHNRANLLDKIKGYGYNYTKEVINGDWELAIWK